VSGCLRRRNTALDEQGWAAGRKKSAALNDEKRDSYQRRWARPER